MHTRGDEGATRPLTLQSCADGSEAMTLLKAVHHETTRCGGTCHTEVPGKQKSRRRSSLRT